MEAEGVKFSEEEVTEYRSAFGLFDADADGRITVTELGAVMRQLGYRPPDAELQRMIDDVDRNHNGTVEFDEFMAMVARRQATVDEDEQMHEAFMVFDQDGDGFISRTELRQVMGLMGEALNDEDLSTMMVEADINCDGRIDFDEFRIMMEKSLPNKANKAQSEAQAC